MMEINVNFSTTELEKIGFAHFENTREWHYKIDGRLVIIYHIDLDSLCLSDILDDDMPNIMLKIFTLNELIRRLPLIVDFALLIE